MNKLSSYLCLILLVLLMLFPLCCWVASMAGMDVVNPLSAEALRWLFKQGPLALVSVHLALVILFVTAVGTFLESGWGAAFRAPYSSSFRIASILFIIILGILLLPVILPHNSLLSVTGVLFPSPWFCGFPLGVCCDIILCSVLYALMSHSWQGVNNIPHLLSIGLSRYGLWVVDFMMASFLLALIRYYLPFI